MNPRGTNFDGGTEALNKLGSAVGRGKTQVLQGRTLPRVRPTFFGQGLAAGLSPPRGAVVGPRVSKPSLPGGG